MTPPVNAPAYFREKKRQAAGFRRIVRIMDVEIPQVLGVMILPEAALFPGALLPLHIFEPRYRQMLARSLETHRMFAVGMAVGDGDQASAVGGAGIIRACVANADGTSNLILQGVGRVRFAQWLTGQTYPLARTDTLPSHISAPLEAEDLREEVRLLCDRLLKKGSDMPHYFGEVLGKTGGALELSDLVSATVVEDPAFKQRLMEEQDAVRRLQWIATYLRHRCQA